METQNSNFAYFSGPHIIVSEGDRTNLPLFSEYGLCDIREICGCF